MEGRVSSEYTTDLKDAIDDFFSDENVDDLMKIAPDISHLDAKFTCRVALMRLIEFFNFNLPEYLERDMLRQLVICLGGDVNNQNSAAWQAMQQQKDMKLRPDCLLLRKGDPGTPENEVFYFNVDKYHELSKQPEYAMALQYIRELVSDDLMRRYMVCLGLSNPDLHVEYSKKTRKSATTKKNICLTLQDMDTPV